jgi:hypothetical protein
MVRVILLLVTCMLVIGSTAIGDGVSAPPGFTALFNGRDLAGWRHDAEVEKHWRVVDGVLTYDGKNDSLRTEKNYRNFILMLRWKIGKGGDSGIYLRGKPQVQIWDNPIGSGGLYNDGIDPRRNVDKPVGEWNQFIIIMRGKRVTVIENGVQVVDGAVMNSIGGMPDEGPIELQHHGSALWFKDIFVRELPGGRERENGRMGERGNGE